MHTKQVLLLVLLFQCAAPSVAAKTPTNNSKIPYFSGPFQSTQRSHQTSAAHFYIYNKSGNPFTINLECLSMNITSKDLAVFHHLMVRVFDTDEKLISRKHITSSELTQIENLPAQISIQIPKSSPGVAQVVVTGGRTGPATFNLTTTPTLPFGIMSSIKVITPPKHPITKGFIYIPPGASQLHIEPIDTDISLWDENGKILLKNKPATLNIEKTDVVWKISLKPKKWPKAKIFTEGFDVIICPDPNTAKAIGGSIERLDDGTIVAHKFQVRLDRLLRKTFSSPKDFKLHPVKSFEPIADIFISDPLRYQYLITHYKAILPYLNLWFDCQIIDPNSPFFGGIYSPSNYSGAMKRYKTTNAPNLTIPAVTNQLEHDKWASFSVSGIDGSMAFLYNLDKEINPYWHDKHLLNRIIISSCRNLILLDESELIHGRRGNDWMGTYAFSFRYNHCDAYGQIGQVVKEHYPQIYNEWTNGINRFADRIMYMSVFAPANQAAHIPYGLWQLYKGSKDPYYYEATKYTSQKLCEHLQKPAGYYVEGYGPCASYAGITLDLFAMLYIDSKIPLFKESIQKAYYCFNHTVAPEPDGTLIGATDFNHRVQKPWTVSQHGSGRAMMAPYLAEAGRWFRSKPTEEELEKTKNRITKKLKEIPYSSNYLLNKADFEVKYATGVGWRHFKYYNPEIIKTGLFPYEEKKTFIRNLGDEFVAVKQQGYYTLIYLGKPGIPPTNNPISALKAGPRTGGGISLLWTPDYNVVLAGQGWNSFSHHGIIVETKPDKVHYADYYSVEFELDEHNKKLTVNGKIKDTPLKYARNYSFDTNSINIKTIIESEQNFQAKFCYLQLPVFVSKQRGFSYTVLSYEPFIIRLFDDNKASFYLHFNEPVSAELGQISQEKVDGTDYKIQQLKIYLPSKWKKGQQVELEYKLLSR